MDFFESKFFQFFVDLKNFLVFKKQIKQEMKDPNSGMNRLGIKRNWLGNILYTQINCTDAEFMGVDYDFNRLLAVKLKPFVDYLSTELGWGEYLVPQVSNFVDDEQQPTLSYGVLFIFAGYSMTLTKLLLWILFLVGIIVGGLILIF